jgi:hypothetical protein
MTRELGWNKIPVQYRMAWKTEKAESMTMGIFGYQGAIIEQLMTGMAISTVV